MTKSTVILVELVNTTQSLRYDVTKKKKKTVILKNKNMINALSKLKHYNRLLEISKRINIELIICIDIVMHRIYCLME